MRLFVVQSLIAVAALLGLTLLGVGPRAWAGFIPAGSGAAALAGAGDPSPADDRAWPPQIPKPQELALPAAFGPQGAGGAGSSTSGPPPSGGQAGLPATTDTASPPPVARLLSTTAIFSPSPNLADVFEPPRGG